MDPITLVIVGGLLLAAVVTFWPWIVDFFITRLVPWVRRRSPAAAEAIVALINWADKVATPSRATIRNCASQFSKCVLGVSAEYERVSATRTTRTVTTHVLNDKGVVSQQVVTEEVPDDEIPLEIREEMRKQQQKKATLDIKAVALEKIRQRALEDGMLLEEMVTQ